MTTSYHWVMTLQTQTPRGLFAITREGTIDLAPGGTRQAAYLQVHDAVMGEAVKHGGGGTPVVLLWSLERNEVEEVARP